MPLSLSKTPVERDIAQELVNRHICMETTLVEYRELEDGYFNAAYYLALDDGRRLVLKVAPPPSVRVLRYETNILRTEVEAMRQVSAKTQVPVPAILAYDDRCDLLPSPCYLMEFIDGDSFHKLRSKFSADDQAAIDRETGSFLRQINEISGAAFGYPGRPQEQSQRWSEAFLRMFENVIQDGIDIGVSLPYDELRALTTRHLPALNEVTSPRLVHWDLWDGNIFIDPVSRRITGIIDFERALWADPLMECNFGAFGINPEFMAGYGIELPFTPLQAARRKLYNLYLYLVMVIECTYRQYATHDQENWARGMLQREMESQVGE